MKKFIALALVICLVFAGVVTYTKKNAENPLDALAPEAAAEEVGAENTAEPAEEAAEPEIPIELDFDALYALHQPQDVVMDLNGEPVTWEEYFYCLISQATEMQNSLQQLKLYYGMSVAWDDPLDEEGKETVTSLTLDNALEMLKQQHSILAIAEDNAVELTEEEEQQLLDRAEQLKIRMCGEEATEEDFDKALDTMHLSRGRFETVNRISVLYNHIKTLFADAVADEEAAKYLEDNGYLAANHILLLSMDPTTGEAYDEAAVAEKKAKAEELASQLAAIEDEAERKETFAELKEELCEDTGKAYFPDGYLFTPGTMVAEFEEAAKALQPYEVSGVVESSYGFHILMGLPLDPDMSVLDQTGNATTARALCAAGKFNAEMQSRMDASEVEMRNGYIQPKLADFVVTAAE